MMLLSDKNVRFRRNEISVARDFHIARATDARRKGISMRTIAISNYKGGVGKTTTAVNLASIYASQGKRVLLIDLDPQGNTSSGLGIEKGELDRCVYDVLIDDETTLLDVIVPDVCDGLVVAPATINLAGAEV